MSKKTAKTPPSLTIADVRAAADRIREHVVHTPLIRNRVLDEIAGAELFLKPENLQHVGAFKARGAFHAIGKLDDAQKKRGIITYSSGNHAQAVALAAKFFGLRCAIAMPTDAPAIKLQAVEQLGATVVQWGTTSDERYQAALEIQKNTGGTIIPPFDHPDIVSAAGTATLELIEDIKAAVGAAPDALLVPVGGGGLIAGACLVCSEEPTEVFGVEPIGCDALRASLAEGERVNVIPGATIADGLKPQMIGELNFSIAKAHVKGSFGVSDSELGEALLTLLFHTKLMVEPSGAAGLAIALRGDVQRAIAKRPLRIGVILSGGNVSPERIASIMASQKPVGVPAESTSAR